ncbi:hypothetical protein A2767_00785 [Candidatus Roizmanbacteria bacterium RIFCSPHIGHO2_01_FULL_35_10]|uniref:Polysaccharide biosynthesis protein C-terminal domain-containing protein n=1 Tax=Candidatus Roizmanbacteria bacterium RIFCSPLOWO2_01_FULL_35_13 TaxID=1802055 RepID=A0A1F7I7T0_9BACT|nr:MAG: hypothetical protein A2767_00785 [Candidatus Roizmanbacteria bacterium RIFCSPHIGHO2_01_FULL_35_10]OGK39429.1 MAG: hypothetical protein A3A74_04870 [Candidatus Roizmanbacteria bacterium RIFCSPLOWO2_01_FULL_35_13]
MKKTSQLFNNEFLQGGFYYFLSSLFINLLNYLFNFLVGRGLGPINYGEISSLFAYAYIALVPTQVFSAYVIKKIGSSTVDQLNYVKSLEYSFKKKFGKFLLLFLLLFLTTPLVSAFTNLRIISILIMLIIILVGYLGSFYSGALQALRYFFVFSLLGLIATFIKFMGGLAIFLGVPSLLLVYFFLLISALFMFLSNYYYLKFKLSRLLKDKIEINSRPVINVLKNRQFQILFLSTLSLTLLNNADLVFVKKTLSGYESGIYASWSLFAKIILYAIGPMLAISFVFFSAKSQTNKHALTLKISFFALTVIFISAYFIYTYFSETLINIFFGSKFLAVLPYLSYASIFGSLYAGLIYLNSYFLAKEDSLALVIPILTPLYLLALFFIKKNILGIIQLNISFSFLVLLVYLTFYLKEKLYSYFKPFQRPFSV